MGKMKEVFAHMGLSAGDFIEITEKERLESYWMTRVGKSR